MNAITARVPCVARTRTKGDEQFEQSALTVRPWLPGTSHELGVVLRRGSREYLLNVAQAHALADELVDAAETAQQMIQTPRNPHPQKYLNPWGSDSAPPPRESRLSLPAFTTFHPHETPSP